MIAELNSQTWWWAARSTGIVAWALVTASILWGLTLSSKLIRKKGIPAWLLDLHRYLGTLSIVFTGMHLAALVADNFLYFGPRELFVPFASGYRPRAVNWGIVAMYLLVAVQLTSWWMRRMPRKVWHAVHLSSFVVFITATIHGALAGADRTNTLVQWVALTGTTWVLFLVVFRLLAPKRAVHAASRIPAAARAAAAGAASAETSAVAPSTTAPAGAGTDAGPGASVSAAPRNRAARPSEPATETAGPVLTVTRPQRQRTAPTETSTASNVDEGGRPNVPTVTPDASGPMSWPPPSGEPARP